MPQQGQRNTLVQGSHHSSMPHSRATAGLLLALISTAACSERSGEVEVEAQGLRNNAKNNLNTGNLNLNLPNAQSFIPTFANLGNPLNFGTGNLGQIFNFGGSFGNFLSGNGNLFTNENIGLWYSVIALAILIPLVFLLPTLAPGLLAPRSSVFAQNKFTEGEVTQGVLQTEDFISSSSPLANFVNNYMETAYDIYGRPFEAY